MQDYEDDNTDGHVAAPAAVTLFPTLPRSNTRSLRSASAPTPAHHGFVVVPPDALAAAVVQWLQDNRDTPITDGDVISVVVPCPAGSLPPPPSTLEDTDSQIASGVLIDAQLKIVDAGMLPALFGTMKL